MTTKLAATPKKSAAIVDYVHTQRKLDIALKALRFYADRSNYGYDHHGDHEDTSSPGFPSDSGNGFIFDNGCMAAVALEKIGEKLPADTYLTHLIKKGPAFIRGLFEKLP